MFFLDRVAVLVGSDFSACKMKIAMIKSIKPCNRYCEDEYVLWSHGLGIRVESRSPIQTCSDTAVQYRYYCPYNVQSIFLHIISFMFSSKVTLSHSGVDGNSGLLVCGVHFVDGEIVSELSTIHATLIFEDNRALWIDLP